jgi:uncharacterized RDD family membrane protein YckC
MQTVRIRTSQNIEIDYEVAGLGDRILARMIDAGVFTGLFYIVYYIIILFYLSIFRDLQSGSGVPTALIVIAIVYTLLYTFYDLAAEVFFNGQSVGKYAMKIKVVSLDGSRPTLGQYLLRWVFRLLDFGITGGVAALISVAVSENKQRIGDIVAGTTLIKTKPATSLADLYFGLPDEDYEPLFPQVSALTDIDITLVYDVITNFKRTGNSSLVYELTKKVIEYLGIAIPQTMNDYEFLQTIGKDYSSVTAKAGV